MLQRKIKETIVPVIAPLTPDLKLDVEAVDRIFAYLHANNASPFILGTTGEAASLSNAFREEYLKTAVASKNVGQNLYVGISSNILEDTIAFANCAFDLGVEVAAVTLPTYYHLSEKQMERYFLQLADHCATELIIYNIPVTTHMTIPLALLEKLSHHPKIVAVKDSERSMDRLSASLDLFRDRPDFKHYMGWAGQAGYALLHGSAGVVPSTGNFAPAVYAQMCEAAEAGDEDRVYQLQRQSDALGDLYQSGRSLGESLWALKVLMKELGLCDSHMMPPLYEGGAQEEQAIKKAFYELIHQENIILNIASHV